MKYEFRKIFTNRYCVLLLILLWMCNGYFYYQHLNQKTDGGYTYSQMKQMYQKQNHFDEIETELEERRNLIIEKWKQADDADYAEFLKLEQDDSLITKNIYYERTLLKAVKERICHSESYETTLAQRIAEARVQQQSGLFGTSGFSVAVLQRTQDEYQQLQGWLTPKVDFFGGVELLIDFPLTDVFLLLFGGAAAFILIAEEKASGMLSLTHPTKSGHAALYIRKYGTMLCLLVGGALLLYGTNFILTVQQLGLGDLSAPVQSIYGMDGCPRPFTVQGFLEFFYGLKVLWVLAISSLFWGLCCWMPQAFHAIGAGLCLFVGTVLLGQTPNHWLRILDLAALLHTDVFFKGCFFLNFFGRPISRLACLYWEMILFILIGFLGGILTYCRLPAISAARKYNGHSLRMGRHTSLFVHEGFKLFWMEGGFIILALFLLVQGLDQSQVPGRENQSEMDYWHYSQILSGAPNKEKDDYLKAEQARFDEIERQIQIYAQQCGDDKNALHLLTEDLRAQLDIKNTFDRVQKQYNSLQPGQTYVYQTGYEWLYQAEGVQERHRNATKLLIVCILGLAGIFAVEQETGVSNLICSYGGEQQIRRCKRILIAIYLLCAEIIAFLPQYIAVHSTLGLPYLEAQANSITMWGMLPSWCQIWMVLLLTELVYLAFGGVAVWIISAVSRKTGNRLMTVLITAALLLVPMLLLL